MMPLDHENIIKLLLIIIFIMTYNNYIDMTILKMIVQ